MTSMGFSVYDDPEVMRTPLSQAAPAPEPTEEASMESARSSFDEHGAGALLSDRDRGILEFERQWWKYAGAKEQAIRDLFDMSATRYYQIVNALAFDPMLVKRLRRLRATRQRARSARRLGVELDQR
jgi:Protein of unknown function (DUF3263)